tara:strand:- start:609 stop:785 length:177 start_codon:yes stop_codon:yes gene_type:complete
MAKANKNNESELKVNVLIHHERIKQLEKRIIRMERAFDALDRRLEGNARHPEDEGWFD